MRLLFVTNYYPPHYIGGYELHCARVAEWILDAGHSVRVVTSSFRNSDGPELAGIDVFRELELRYWTDITDLAYWRRERRDTACFRRHLRAFRPDIVVLWNMHKLASGIVLEAQRLAPMLAYHLMDEWAANFRDANGLPQFFARSARSPWGRVAKPLARALYRSLFTEDVSSWQPRNAAIVSKALGRLMESHDVRFPNAHVSYITYEPALFEALPPREPLADGAPVRFLWAGRLCEGKGLRTTLRALDLLHKRHPNGWRVDFCGPIDARDRESILEPPLQRAPWREQVRYLGSLPHQQMPRQYGDHDIFLFTSEVHEGLPGTIIEAFASGMAVIATLTGGTHDVLQPDQNCLVYPMGDAEALAAVMERMITDSALRRQLSASVADYARESFSNTAVFPRLLAFYESLLEGARKT